MFFKKFSPAIVCGFGVGVLGLIPILNNAACCLLLPAASVLSLNIHKKINPDDQIIDISKALLFGLVTGISAAFFAGIFETVITFVVRTNDFVESLPLMESTIKDILPPQYTNESFKIFRSISSEIKTSGFSLIYTFMFFTGNLIIYSIFGMLGGLLGMSFLNKRR